MIDGVMSMKRFSWLTAVIIILSFRLAFQLYELSVSHNAHYSSQLHLYQKDTLINLSSDKENIHSSGLMEEREICHCVYRNTDFNDEYEIDKIARELSDLSHFSLESLKDKMINCPKGQSILLLQDIALNDIPLLQDYVSDKASLELIWSKEKRANEIRQQS